MSAGRFLSAAALAVCALAGPIAVAGESPPVAVLNAWARETPGGVTIGAAYAELRNSGSAADILTAANSPVAGRCEIHSHAMVDGVMRMRRLETIEIPAGETVAFRPGGHHFMMFDLKQPLKAGGTIPVTLTFKYAGDVTVEAKVFPLDSQGPGSREK
jgi:hypothetical protein